MTKALRNPRQGHQGFSYSTNTISTCLDLHTESLTTTSRVSVIVTDANDHAPIFDSFPFRINVSTTSPPEGGVPLLRLSASDRDAPGGPNSKLTYNLLTADNQVG